MNIYKRMTTFDDADVDLHFIKGEDMTTLRKQYLQCDNCKKEEQHDKRSTWICFSKAYDTEIHVSNEMKTLPGEIDFCSIDCLTKYFNSIVSDMR